MTADAFIQFRVTPEVKARIRAIAVREQIPDSTLVRQLIENMLRVQEPLEGSKSNAEAAGKRASRLYVRLRLEDRKLLRVRALARQVPAATYVALLVRCHLQGVAPIPEAELVELRQSISELRAIARTLNAIARARARDGDARQPGQGDILRLMKVGEVLLQRTKALYAANAKSWETGDGETSRTA